MRGFSETYEEKLEDLLLQIDRDFMEEEEPSSFWNLRKIQDLVELLLEEHRKELKKESGKY